MLISGSGTIELLILVTPDFYYLHEKINCRCNTLHEIWRHESKNNWVLKWKPVSHDE